MRIIFDEAFHESDYTDDRYDNAAEPGRLVGIVQALREEGRYSFEVPRAAARADLLRGHAEEYVTAVEAKPRLFAMASLAVGAAMLAAERAADGEPSFACVRPPGHHASRASAWGRCTFGNLALALLRLRDAGRIRSALVFDFDQHTGDGTLDLLRGWPEARVFNGHGDDPAAYVAVLAEHLKAAPQVDIVAVSAGFDGYALDVGRKMTTESYFEIGALLRGYATRLGHGRRFAVLEGGYYQPHLGRNVLSFCRGFE
jgi:acetoin utilization deacetylase AcuC-like enzyme